MPFQAALKSALVFFAALMLIRPLAVAQSGAAPNAIGDRHLEELRGEAALNLHRLKTSIEKDGFYSARIALNIWRSTAERAGTFNPELYDRLKNQLYDKAMADSLGCYNDFMRQKDYNNAKTCLLIWRSHAKEIGRYDPAAYRQLQEGLERLKKK